MPYTDARHGPQHPLERGFQTTARGCRTCELAHELAAFTKAAITEADALVQAQLLLLLTAYLDNPSASTWSACADAMEKIHGS